MGNCNSVKGDLTSRRAVLGVIRLGLGAVATSGVLGRTGRSATVTLPTIRRNDRDPTLGDQRERCLLAEGLADELEVAVGSQVRVGSPDGGRYESALFTVVGTDAAPNTVETSAAGLDRLGVTHGAAGFVRPYAPSPDHDTRAAAADADEYAEVVVDDGEQSALVASAPHGGWVEYGTDRQSRHVARTLGATEWSCAGYNSGGGAYDRWHVTSTAISRRSFPGLDSIADRGFEHAVSFHGFGGDGVLVGGGAPRTLRLAVRDAIREATEGQYEVALAPADGSYGGDSPENVVNWLAGGDGVQVEQSWRARRDDWGTIATAVATVYDGET